MAKAYQVKQVLNGETPPEPHRKLAIEAQEEGISLNRLASNKLSKQDA